MEDYKNVLQALGSFVESLKSTLEQSQLIGVEPWPSLVEEIYGIYELLNDPAISAPIDNTKLTITSPVEKFGVGGIVVAFYEDGLNPAQIAEQLRLQGIAIKEGDVRRWLKEYETSPITERVDKATGSVFDTQTQLQSIFDYIHELKHQIQTRNDSVYAAARTTKEQVLLQLVSELRQTIKDGAALAQAVANMQTVDNFKKIVIEEISKESPAAQQRIYKKIREAKVMFSSLDM